MEKEIIERLRVEGFTPSDLTEDELETLRKEIEFERSGGMILDGVLSNPEIYFRKLTDDGVETTRGKSSMPKSHSSNQKI
ncbi:MAG: hypothetical protein K5893_02040 [Prevotella sp.]|nr:hypothetical protein [Prevotella sp.]